MSVLMLPLVIPINGRRRQHYTIIAALLFIILVVFKDILESIINIGNQWTEKTLIRHQSHDRTGMKELCSLANWLSIILDVKIVYGMPHTIITVVISITRIMHIPPTIIARKVTRRRRKHTGQMSLYSTLQPITSPIDTIFLVHVG